MSDLVTIGVETKTHDRQLRPNPGPLTSCSCRYSRATSVTMREPKGERFSYANALHGLVDLIFCQIGRAKLSIVRLRRRSRLQSVQVDRRWLTNLYNSEITAGSVCTDRRMGRVLFQFRLNHRVFLPKSSGRWSPRSVTTDPMREPKGERFSYANAFMDSLT